MHHIISVSYAYQQNGGGNLWLDHKTCTLLKVEVEYLISLIKPASPQRMSAEIRILFLSGLFLYSTAIWAI